MISEEHKVVFVSIPRTGGHTINSIFHKKGGGNPGLNGGRHIFPCDYISQAPKKWQKYFVFTIVRNPFDRLISYWSRSSRGYLSKVDLQNEEIFQQVKKDFNYFVVNNLKSFINKTHYKPQYLWFEIPKGFKNYDYVCRFENFTEELNRVFEKIGMEKREEIPRTFGAPRRRGYQEYYTPKAIEIVSNLYAKDLEMFKYKF